MNETPHPAHTPEPWIVAGDSIVTSDDQFCIATVETDGGYEAPDPAANAARIVACVNALAGIQDPAGALQAARDVATKLGALEESRMICAEDMVELFQLGRTIAKLSAISPAKV